MSDITMCRDDQCKKHKKCHRFTAPVNEYRQSFFVHSPLSRDGKSCVMFWDNKGYAKEGDRYETVSNKVV